MSDDTNGFLQGDSREKQKEWLLAVASSPSDCDYLYNDRPIASSSRPHHVNGRYEAVAFDVLPSPQSRARCKTVVIDGNTSTMATSE